jgi:hypothetical protein
MTDTNVGSLLLRVTLGDAVALRLDHDPSRARRALARGGDWALSYTDRSLAPSLREAVLAIGKAFERTRPSSGAEALSLLEGLVAEHLAGAAIEPAAATVEAFPRWSGAIRSTPAQPGSFWPFDAELSGLRRGVRRLIKRDGLAPHEVQGTLDWFAAHDVVTRVAVEADGRRVVFAAVQAELLATALEAEAALAAHDVHSDEAARWLGDALGYPACCIARFISLSGRDDAALAQALLPALPAAPASALTMWLHAPLSLHSHSPCSLGCEATRALGRATLDALEHERPGFAAWWRSLAQRLHVVDGEGRCFAFAGAGELAQGFVITDAVASDPRGESLRPWPELVGALAQLRERRVVLAFEQREHVAVLAADHRAD